MAATLPSVLIIIPWFGPWPAWMRFFVESCRWNPTVDWLLLSDAQPPEHLPPNLRVVTTKFEDYRELIARRLDIRPAWADAYMLCDLKPALGFIHQSEIAGYDYWGYGDLDVIYGDIRGFYTPEILVHDVISTHGHIVSGHFALLRTTPHVITAFQQIPAMEGTSVVGPLRELRRTDLLTAVPAHPRELCLAAVDHAIPGRWLFPRAVFHRHTAGRLDRRHQDFSWAVVPGIAAI